MGATIRLRGDVYAKSTHRLLFCTHAHGLPLTVHSAAQPAFTHFFIKSEGLDESIGAHGSLLAVGATLGAGTASSRQFMVYISPV